MKTARAIAKRARVSARRSAVQALYQWHMTGKSIQDVIAEFEEGRSELKHADIDYFRDLLLGISGCCDEADEKLGRLLDRPLQDLDPVELSILRIGYYELVYHPELPWRVVINESVELAKMFGAEQSYKYVNGVLDRLARVIRADEIANLA